MLQSISLTKELDARVAQIVSRQLQNGDFLSKLRPQQTLQVVHIQHAVFDDQGANVWLERKVGQLLDKLVLLAHLKKKVQVDDQLGEAAVVGQDLLEENIFVLTEEVKRVVADPELLRSPEQLNCANVDSV